MTDRPIIFSAPMVPALLDGRKTMTRRMAWRSVGKGGLFEDTFSTVWQKVRPGDRLWVRENFRNGPSYDGVTAGAVPWFATKWYEAGPARSEVLRTPITAAGKLRPSIHMPRWASRLTLVVTGEVPFPKNGKGVDQMAARG